VGLLLVGAPRAAEQEETLRVDAITISGNYLVFRSDILRRLGLEPGATIRETAFRRRVERVNEWGGFGTLSVEIARLEDRDVALRLRLREQVQVERVRFVGNRSIKDPRLEGLVGFGPGGGVTPDDARAAERTIREAYRRRERPLASVTASARFPGY
jgi:outer membrane protein assembly factor BamA